MSELSPANTISCLLCGGSFLYPGPRYSSHLLHEHGVVYDRDFLVQVSLHKKTFSSLPEVAGPAILGADNSSQTDTMCDTCQPSSRGEEEDNSHTYIINSMDDDDLSKLTGDNPEYVDLIYQADQSTLVIEDVLKPQADSDTKVSSSKSPRISPKPNIVPLASDLHCYFDCGTVFKKGYDLEIHLRLRHNKEDPTELAKAFEAMKFEIALTQRSGTVYQCGLCSKTVVGWASFWEHIRKHGYNWHDYRDKFGKCVIESANFQCRICNKVLKHEANCIHKHLQSLHGINWTQYLARVRGELRGIKQEPLPQIQLVNCKICDLNFKYFVTHLQRRHKLTMEEYQQLLREEESKLNSSNAHDTNQNLVTVTIAEPVARQQTQNQSHPPKPDQLREVKVTRKIPKPSKKDMINKKVKQCNVCDVEFETRKQFLEHCTDIHEIKFRNKSTWSSKVKSPQDGRVSAGDDFKMFLSRRSLVSTQQVEDCSQNASSSVNLDEGSSSSSLSQSHESKPMSIQSFQIVWPKRKFYSCENCGEKFESWKERDKHKMMNCRFIDCEACGKSFTTVAKLKKHRLTRCLGSSMPVPVAHSVVHELVEEILTKVFSLSSGSFDGCSCPHQDCGQQFGRRVHLKRHLSNFHDTPME